VVEKRGLAVSPDVELIGRSVEVSTLSTDLTLRKSRLILGPGGIGKTRLIHEALSTSEQPFVSITKPAALHDLLVMLAKHLSCRSPRFLDLRDATTVHLKPLVLNGLSANPQCVILEDLEEVEPRMYRFLQKLYYVPGACLIATGRSRSRLGRLQRLLWEPREELVLKPLSRRESLQLFEEACRAFRLHLFDSDGFRQRVIQAAHGNPGQILSMCRLAGQPEYRSGDHIKFAPLWIDVLSAFV
jgi:hypothetical protein